MRLGGVETALLAKEARLQQLITLTIPDPDPNPQPRPQPQPGARVGCRLHRGAQAAAPRLHLRRVGVRLRFRARVRADVKRQDRAGRQAPPIPLMAQDINKL